MERLQYWHVIMGIRTVHLISNCTNIPYWHNFSLILLDYLLNVLPANVLPKIHKLETHIEMNINCIFRTCCVLPVPLLGMLGTTWVDLLRKITITDYTTCWEVFPYYSGSGLTSSLCKRLLLFAFSYSAIKQWILFSAPMQK